MSGSAVEARAEAMPPSPSKSTFGLSSPGSVSPPKPREIALRAAVSSVGTIQSFDELELAI